jgi:hypothetical protein
VEDINGFVFGGVNSRFWMMKNYINALPVSEDLPSHLLCWNMLSI